MRVTTNLLLHPFKYPEWGEMLLAFLGLGQFIFALWNMDDLYSRPAFELTILLSIWAWVAGGLLLFGMHIGSLRFGGTQWGYQARLIAVGSSLAFWSHFILSIVANSVFFNGPFPGTLIPSLGTPLLAGAVLYRLWRRY